MHAVTPVHFCFVKSGSLIEISRTGAKSHVYLIALFFCCLLAILIFDHTDTDLRTAQPVTMDDIHD